MNLLAGWENFYVIVGSSSGALIGLQFVVMTLFAARPAVSSDVQKVGRAFATPSVIHFAVVLLLSAIMSAPWTGTEALAAIWGGVGVPGILYIIFITRRLLRQTIYRPVFEDWAFHSILPLGAYAILCAAAWLSRSDFPGALFVLAAAVLLMLFIGIHNAWDAVTYHVFSARPEHG
ncbi:MAG TPA: hypothetical protein VML00_08550 [Bacteroidota bacterium]|nr:hypothetical protein [Bacteroidota bacterium]